MRIAWLRDLRPEFHTNVQRSIFFTWPQTTGSNLHNQLPGLIETTTSSSPSPPAKSASMPAIFLAPT